MAMVSFEMADEDLETAGRREGPHAGGDFLAGLSIDDRAAKPAGFFGDGFGCEFGNAHGGRRMMGRLVCFGRRAFAMTGGGWRVDFTNVHGTVSNPAASAHG